MNSGTGELPRWIRVQCQRQGGSGLVHARVKDNEGRFRVGPLAPGAHLLSAWSSEMFGTSRYAQAEAGDIDVVILMNASESVAGVVVDEFGEPVDAHVGFVFEGGGSLGIGTGSSGKGVFQFADLRPGLHSVSAATKDGRVALQQVKLEPGMRVMDLRLSLVEGARLGLHLEGPH